MAFSGVLSRFICGKQALITSHLGAPFGTALRGIAIDVDLKSAVHDAIPGELVRVVQSFRRFARRLHVLTRALTSTISNATHSCYSFQAKLRNIKKAHGDKSFGGQTVDSCIGGMRGITVSMYGQCGSQCSTVQ